MDLLTYTFLFLGMAVLGLWAYRRQIGWICVVSGIGTMTTAVAIAADSLAYGFPYIVIGIGIFLFGAINIRKLA